jgi:hypothetical protein
MHGYGIVVQADDARESQDEMPMSKIVATCNYSK